MNINRLVNIKLFGDESEQLYEDQLGPCSSPAGGVGYIVKQYPFLANFTTIFGYDENGKIVPRNKLKNPSSIK